MEAKFDFDLNIAQMCIARISDRMWLANKFLRDRVDVTAFTRLEYDRPAGNTDYDFCDPTWLKGSPKLIYEHCLAQGLNPTLVPSDKPLSPEGAHCRVFSIFIDVPPPPEPVKVAEPAKTAEAKVEEPKAKEQEAAKPA